MYFDLHGLTESEAILEIDAILWALESGEYEEVEIVTGNGIVLKDLVIEEVQKRDLAWKHPFHNSGSIIVYRN